MKSRPNIDGPNAKFGTRLLNLIFASGFTLPIFGLVSCGGGDVSGSSSITPTIAYMTAFPAGSGAPGIIAAPEAQPLTIYGANFISGMNVTVTNNTTNYPVTSTVVVSSSEISTHITIPSVPNDNYVTVTLQSPNGISVSGILGVAHAYRTLANDIQMIFASNCVSCHDSSGIFDLSTVLSSAMSLIQAQSLGCPQSLLVTAGEPRRISNVLVDVIKSKATPGSPATLSCNNSITRQMPQGVSPPLSTAEIDAIVDWIALGAN